MCEGAGLAPDAAIIACICDLARQTGELSLEPLSMHDWSKAPLCVPMARLPLALSLGHEIRFNEIGVSHSISEMMWEQGVCHD